MKQELIKGNWYSLIAGGAKWYIKYLKTEKNIKASAYINNSLKYVEGDEYNFGEPGYYDIVDIDMSEIAHLLPQVLEPQYSIY